MSHSKRNWEFLRAGRCCRAACKATSYEATKPDQFQARDKEYLARSPTLKPRRRTVRRAIVEYPAKKRRARSWSIPTIIIFITCRMAARRSGYGITVGEEAMAWSGIAKVGSMTDGRLGIRRRARSPASACRNSSPRGRIIDGFAGAVSSTSGGKDTLFRISWHQPTGYIGRLDFLGLYPHDQ